MTAKKSAQPLGTWPAPRQPPGVFTLARRWIELGCTEGAFAGFSCELAALSEDERAPLRPSQGYDALTAKMAPLVRSWNLPFPAPGDAGPRAFDAVDLGLVQYIRQMLICAAYLQDHGPIDMPTGKVVA